MKSKLSYATWKLQFIIASTERDIKNGAVRFSPRLWRLRCSFNVAEASSKAIWSCLTWLSEQMWRRNRRVEEFVQWGCRNCGMWPLVVCRAADHCRSFICSVSRRICTDCCLHPERWGSTFFRSVEKRPPTRRHMSGDLKRSFGITAVITYNFATKFVGFILFEKYWVNLGTVGSAEHTAHMGAKRAAWTVRSWNVRRYHMKG
jgi:hypothetical protein